MTKEHEGEYRTAERASYKSPPCPECGGRTITNWVATRSLADTEDWWIPGTYRCADPGRHGR